MPFALVTETVVPLTEHPVETPALTMTYTIAKPVSPALKSYQLIEVENIVAEYPTVFGTRTQTFGRLRFILRQEKKSEARV